MVSQSVALVIFFDKGFFILFNQDFIMPNQEVRSIEPLINLFEKVLYKFSITITVCSEKIN